MLGLYFIVVTKVEQQLNLIGRENGATWLQYLFKGTRIIESKCAGC